MKETNKRRKVGRRLSLFTDILIIIILLLIFSLIMHFTKKENNASIISEDLALESLDEYDRNIILSDKIYSDFGVKVIYGENATDDAERVSATIQENMDVITDNLINIYNIFSVYPKEYFKENNLTIVILDKFSNNNIALASRNNLNQYKIYISNAEEYYRALNHEMYHVFEYMIANEVGELNDIWIGLNPAEFEYNSDVYKLDDKFVYDKSGSDLKNTYFVTKYSKASSKEDRAEVFAEIMTFDTKKQTYFLHGDNPLVTKAKCIIDVMSNEYKQNEKLKWQIFN